MTIYQIFPAFSSFSSKWGHFSLYVYFVSWQILTCKLLKLPCYSWDSHVLIPSLLCCSPFRLLESCCLQGAFSVLSGNAATLPSVLSYNPPKAAKFPLCQILLDSSSFLLLYWSHAVLFAEMIKCPFPSSALDR